jgi:hypothetical protein
VTPPATQWTSLEEHRGAYPRPVLDGVFLYVENQPAAHYLILPRRHREHGVFQSYRQVGHRGLWRFYFTERFKAELIVGAFNLTNTPHFNNPSSALDSTAFGTVTGAFGERQVQLGIEDPLLKTERLSADAADVRR